MEYSDKTPDLLRALGHHLEELADKLEALKSALDDCARKLSWETYDNACCPYGRSAEGHKLWQELFQGDTLRSRN